jgi:hypothetical protein
MGGVALVEASRLFCQEKRHAAVGRVVTVDRPQVGVGSQDLRNCCIPLLRNDGTVGG